MERHEMITCEFFSKIYFIDSIGKIYCVQKRESRLNSTCNMNEIFLL